MLRGSCFVDKKCGRKKAAGNCRRGKSGVWGRDFTGYRRNGRMADWLCNDFVIPTQAGNAFSRRCVCLLILPRSGQI